MRHDEPAVTRPGDLWLLVPNDNPCYRLLAGNARDPAMIATLTGGEQAAMVITDPPYNVPIKGHVSGKGPHPPHGVRDGLRRDERRRVHRLSEALPCGGADEAKSLRSWGMPRRIRVRRVMSRHRKEKFAFISAVHCRARPQNPSQTRAGRGRQAKPGTTCQVRPRMPHRGRSRR